MTTTSKKWAKNFHGSLSGGAGHAVNVEHGAKKIHTFCENSAIARRLAGPCGRFCASIVFLLHKKPRTLKHRQTHFDPTRVDLGLKRGPLSQ